MKKEFYIVLGLLAATVAPEAMAADAYPKQKFDAKYQVSNPQGKSDLRMASDGVGHMLIESVANGFKSTTIVDYAGKASTTLIEQGKMAMKTKLPDGGGYVADDTSVKNAGGKAIGNKVVNGHPCHGFAYSNPGGKNEVWIGDDCHIMVQSTTDTAAGKVVMNLKSVGGGPTADVFKVPPGYKLMGQ